MCVLCDMAKLGLVVITRICHTANNYFDRIDIFRTITPATNIVSQLLSLLLNFSLTFSQLYFTCYFETLA